MAWHCTRPGRPSAKTLQGATVLHCSGLLLANVPYVRAMRFKGPCLPTYVYTCGTTSAARADFSQPLCMRGVARGPACLLPHHVRHVPAPACAPGLQVIAITGANSGLGYEAALALARRHATVIMIVRDLGKGHA